MCVEDETDQCRVRHMCVEDETESVSGQTMCVEDETESVSSSRLTHRLSLVGLNHVCRGRD